MIEKLDGYKTHLAIALFVAFHLVMAGKLVSLSPDTVDAINAALLGAAGIALRAAVKKAEVPQ